MYLNVNKLFKVAVVLSLTMATTLFATSIILSREAVFLMLNRDLGNFGDYLFNFFSHLAEGWIWIPYFMFLFGWYKKDALFILLNFLISTLLTQLPKNFIWDKISRPMASGIPTSQIHTVKGVEMHLWNSFPSGHTATAFTIFLMTVYLFPNKKVLILGFIYAICAAYSRVYLGQHFPLDLAGGIIVAVITIFISIYIRKNEKVNF
jgi:membrane-associated phospholipid phosphatase